jgi:hypothetical protein
MNSLAFCSNQSDGCRDGNHREKEMSMTSNSETTEMAEAPVTEQPKATKKPGAGARGAHVVSKQSKSGKKASPVKKAPKAQKKAGAGRDGSKTAKSSGPAEATGRRHSERPDEGDGLAAAFRARISVRDHQQENGSGRHIQ